MYSVDKETVRPEQTLQGPSRRFLATQPCRRLLMSQLAGNVSLTIIRRHTTGERQ